VTENIGHHGHDDQPDEQLHDDHFDPDAERSREIDEWIDAIISKPWFGALKSLPGDRGLWVGTEDELLEELKERVGPEATLSEDFPSSASEIIEPPDDVVFAMRKERLSIMDYRQMSKKIREDYYGPGWGRSAPIMIGYGLAGRKPYHEAAAYLMTTKYRNPLAALVVEFTYHHHKFTRNNRQWWGRTRELAEQLSIRYTDEVAFIESRRNKELEDALKFERLEDLLRFHRQMRTCAYVLRDVGVKVSWEKFRNRKPETDEEYSYTLWTIEAPHWMKTTYTY
jgi:hypothetical protein